MEFIDRGAQQLRFFFRNPVGAVIALCLVLLYLPFLNKAFHIDDVTFIDFAGMIGWNPANAGPVAYSYMGTVIRDFLPYEGTHPLLIPYFIKIISALFGGSEVALHGLFLVFPMLTILSLARLQDLLMGSRNRSALTALLLVSSPAFLVNSHNIMTDVPTLSLLLLSLVFFVSSFESNAVLMSFLGGVILTLAIFASYQMVVFIPLIILFGTMRRPLNKRLFAGLAIPVSALIAWFCIVYAKYDVLPLVKTQIGSSGFDLFSLIIRELRPKSFLFKAFSILSQIGLSAMFALLYQGIRDRTEKILLMRLVVAALLAFPVMLLITGYPPAASLLLSIYVALGIVTLACALAKVLNCGKEQTISVRFLAVWIITVVLYNLFVLPFGSARYLLPAFPPLMILLVGVDQPRIKVAARGRCAIIVPAFFSVMVGFISAYSDLRHANVYRLFAGEVRQFSQAEGGRPGIWYIGEWGMRYYMEQSGGKYLLRDSVSPVRGDFIVVPSMSRFWQPSPEVKQRARIYATRKYELSLPWRLFNLDAYAGFYAQNAGMLPAALSLEPIEEFQIWKIES